MRRLLIPLAVAFLSVASMPLLSQRAPEDLPQRMPKGIEIAQRPEDKPQPEKPDDKPDKPKEKHGRGYKPLPPKEAAAIHAAAAKRHGPLMKVLVKNTTPPAKFDAVDMGWVQPIVDQGQCGSCYLVSSSDACTGAFIKAGWGKNDGSFKISDQYGLDCKNYGGCNGGDEAECISDMKDKGFPAERYLDITGTKISDYPGYTSNPGQCKLKPGAKMWVLKDFGYVSGDQGQGPATVDEYKAALVTYGQLSIALDAGAFDGYNGGVIARLGNSIDHAITMVGWDDAKKAVRCRNNWGTGWGESGYCWISYDAVPQIVEGIWLLAPQVAPNPNVPVITIVPQVAQVGANFTYQITATNSPTAYTADPLPAGLTVSATTGIISGKPTAAGTYATTVTAINAAGTGTASLPITVGTTPPPPPPPDGTKTVTLGTDMKAGTYYLSSAPITADTTLRDILNILNPPAPTPKTPEEILEALRKLLNQKP